MQASEIVGIDSTVVAHGLNIDPSIKPVIQKKWNFVLERQKNYYIRNNKAAGSRIHTRVYTPQMASECSTYLQGQ